MAAHSQEWQCLARVLRGHEVDLRCAQQTAQRLRGLDIDQRWGVDIARSR